MTILRAVLASVVGAAALSTTALLHWPGWSLAPVVVVLAAAPAYAVGVPKSTSRAGRVDAAMVGLAAALAVVTAVTAVVGVDDTDRDDVAASLTATATETVRALFTFGPADYTAPAAQRRSEALTPRLTGRLLADYRSQGPDVVLPAAVESGAALQTTIEAIGVGDSGRGSVRLLVFATEKITVASADPPISMVSVVRWAVMRRVGSTWRLSDIYPAGISG